MRWIYTFIVILAVGESALSQLPPPRDLQADTVLRLAEAAMGRASAVALQDTSATVRIVSGNAATPATTGTIRTLGPNRLRTDWTTSEGESWHIVDSTGSYLKIGGKDVRFVSRKSLPGGGITHLPMLSTFSEWSDARVKLEYLGPEQDEGRTVLHLRMLRPASIPNTGEFDEPIEVFLDPQTALIHKVVFPVRAPVNLLISELMEVVYRDYRMVAGMAVPFRVSYRVRGNLLSECEITSFAVNQGVNANDFVVGRP